MWNYISSLFASDRAETGRLETEEGKLGYGAGGAGGVLARGYSLMSSVWRSR